MCVCVWLGGGGGGRAGTDHLIFMGVFVGRGLWGWGLGFFFFRDASLTLYSRFYEAYKYIYPCLSYFFFFAGEKES